MLPLPSWVVRDVSCPRCGARPGDRCVKQTGRRAGRPLRVPHEERIDACIVRARS